MTMVGLTGPAKTHFVESSAIHVTARPSDPCLRVRCDASALPSVQLLTFRTSLGRPRTTADTIYSPPKPCSSSACSWWYTATPLVCFHGTQRWLKWFTSALAAIFSAQ